MDQMNRQDSMTWTAGGLSDIGFPFCASGYGASKTAVMRLTETFAAELAEHNVKVFAMGPCETGFADAAFEGLKEIIR